MAPEKDIDHRGSELLRFIAVEGCDGFGKSTLARGLAQKIQDAGYLVELTAEPGGTVLADELRRLFARCPPEESWSVESELMLVSAARSQHLKGLIIPALRQKKWVICDRFSYSTRVYQGWVGGCSAETVEQVIAFTTYGCNPTLTLLLDADPEVIQSRDNTRQSSSTAEHSPEAEQQSIARFDEKPLEFHRKVRQGFLHYAQQNPQHFRILDASLSPEELLQCALDHLCAHWDPAFENINAAAQSHSNTLRSRSTS